MPVHQCKDLFAGAQWEYTEDCGKTHGQHKSRPRRDQNAYYPFSPILKKSLRFLRLLARKWTSEFARVDSFIITQGHTSSRKSTTMNSVRSANLTSPRARGSRLHAVWRHCDKHRDLDLLQKFRLCIRSINATLAWCLPLGTAQWTVCKSQWRVVGTLDMASHPAIVWVGLGPSMVTHNARQNQGLGPWAFVGIQECKSKMSLTRGMPWAVVSLLNERLDDKSNMWRT